MGMRPYWADYANHMLRFYCRNDDPTMIYRFRTRTDEKNWKACNSVMKEMLPMHISMLWKNLLMNYYLLWIA